MFRSKRYRALAQSIPAGSITPIDQAVAVLKQNPVKFDASIEIHVKLGIDPKRGDQIVRASAVLPHGTGKKVRVAAFVMPDKEADAKAAGAVVVGGEELIQEIAKTGKADFDVAVATPDMMKALAPIAKTLGQKGLMPNPKTGTVTPDVRKVVEELTKGKVNFKNDDGANLHQVIGKVSFTDAQLVENFNALLEAVRKAKPDAAKGTYIKGVYVSATMGPSIQVL